MAIKRSSRPIGAKRIATLAGQLLDASTLCAISTVSPGSRAHINTAYFAWNSEFDLVWISEPGAQHSRNLSANATAAVAVYDSHLTWGAEDRGIQLFGTACEVKGATARDADAVYARRFPAYRDVDLSAYHLYRFRPNRIKLFDERVLGGGVFVTAKIGRGGQLAWQRTEIYAGAPQTQDRHDTQDQGRGRMKGPGGRGVLGLE